MAGRSADTRGRGPLHQNPKLAEEKLLSPRHRAPARPRSAAARAGGGGPSIPPQVPANYKKLWPNMAPAGAEDFVRHMSNVPGYLQRRENGGTFQEKALNFGVLDWRRLEKWKDGRPRPAASFDSSTFSARGSPAWPALSSSGGGGCQTPKNQLPSLDGRRDFPVAAGETSSRASSGVVGVAGVPTLPPRGRPTGRRSLSGPVDQCRRRADNLVRAEEYSWGKISPGLEDDCLICIRRASPLTSQKNSDRSRSADARRMKWPVKVGSDDLSPQLLHEDLHGSRRFSFASTGDRGGSPSFPRSCPLSGWPDLDLRGEGESSPAARKLRREPAAGNLSISGPGRCSSMREIPPSSRRHRRGDSEADSGGKSRRGGSPLRRLLDPFLKTKASVPSSPGRKIILPDLEGAAVSEQPRCSSAERVSRSSYGDCSISAAPQRQALLRVSWKDGVPLFTFSVSESEILAAKRQKKTKEAAGEDGGEDEYTFYCVLEGRKKISGGWMKQGNKKELISAVVGQMNVSPSPSPEDQRVAARKFVLRGPDLLPTVAAALHGKADAVPSSELAAVVLSGFDQAHGGKQEEAAPQKQRGEEMVAILPKELHGLSAVGRPATLVDRWRSGGRCDCGGWDAGCPLTTLRAGDAQFQERDGDRVELFAQGRGGRCGRAMFSLVSFREGLYTVEFDSSIAAVQAFAICVSVLHGRKRSALHELLSSRQCSPAGGFPGGAAMPAPYCPPLSPMGRA